MIYLEIEYHCVDSSLATSFGNVFPEMFCVVASNLEKVSSVVPVVKNTQFGLCMQKLQQQNDLILEFYSLQQKIAM